MYSFEELFDRLPLDIVDKTKNIIQDVRYHAEGSIYNHTKLVFEQCLQYQNIDLLISAIFHDLGKINTTKAFIKKEIIRIQNIGHEVYAQGYIDLYKNLYEDLDINWNKVSYICSNHMKMHKYIEGKITKQNKIREIEENKYFEESKLFSIADSNGRIEAENRIVPYLIITLGIPGSGKSTWAKNIIKENSFFERINPDEIRLSLTGNISDQSRNKDVWQIAYHNLKEKLSEKKIVIFDATNVSTTTQKSLEIIAKEKEAIIVYKIFECSKEEAKIRIANDIKQGINRSNVPNDVIDSMYDKFQSCIQDIKEKKILLY